MNIPNHKPEIKFPKFEYLENCTFGKLQPRKSLTY